ncbi:hypothetical protein J41TS4_20700 [Paenibacillus apis]|uniref:Uncharacterized protein n=1 Tax=Paenibacillus apis TaxID=1792174 RepID=A0A920CMP8_9BACL|nr:hypothetical protein J41TS4_20700 [Paenibacillus apis]
MQEPVELQDILLTYSLKDCKELFQLVSSDLFDYSELPNELQKFHRARLWRCLLERIEKGDITVMF